MRGMDGREFGMDRDVTAMRKMHEQQGPGTQNRELCSKLCGSLDGMWSLAKNGYMEMHG